jgi:hypothetical protein
MGEGPRQSPGPSPWYGKCQDLDVKGSNLELV